MNANRINPVFAIVVVVAVLLVVAGIWLRYSGPQGHPRTRGLIVASKVEHLTPADRKASEPIVRKGLTEAKGQAR